MKVLTIEETRQVSAAMATSLFIDGYFVVSVTDESSYMLGGLEMTANSLCSAGTCFSVEDGDIFTAGESDIYALSIDNGMAYIFV